MERARETPGQNAGISKALAAQSGERWLPGDVAFTTMPTVASVVEG